MAAYRKRIGNLFDEKKQVFSLEDTQKDNFVNWAMLRHTRLRACDKK